MDPVFTMPPDDSLVSLSWLQYFNIATLGAPPCSKLVGNCTWTGSTDLQATCGQPPTMDMMDRIAFKSNPSVKPPYSPIELICMAIKESRGNKSTTSGICNWITDNFMYYRMADHFWQRSIRCNLTHRKCFQKVPRRNDEPGNGAFWRIDPEYNDRCINDMYKKSRCTNSTAVNVGPAQKRLRPDMELPITVKQESGDMELPVMVKEESDEAAAAVMYLQNEELPSALTSPDLTWNAIMPLGLERDTVRVQVETDDDQAMSNMVNPSDLTESSSDFESHVSSDDLFNAKHVNLSYGTALDMAIREMASSGLQTPLTTSSLMTSPAHEQDLSHPWGENRNDLDEALVHFNMDLQNRF